MIELIRHIEILLLENDCVVVPGFGGFIAHYMPACINDDDTFSPPLRSIGFNPQLRMNDGLLVQSYMDAYCTDFSDATKILQKDVDNLIGRLHAEGSVDCVSLGTISLSVHGTYVFSPYNDKLVSPYLYGLDAFEIKRVEELLQSWVKTTPMPVPVTRRKTYDIRINRALVRNAVAAVAAILLFFYMSTPIENTYVEKANYAQLLPSDLFSKIEQHSLLTVPLGVEKTDLTEEAPVEIIAEVLEETPVVAEVTRSPEVNLDSSRGRTKSHYIVIASLAVKSDAQAMVEDLQSKGFPDACVLIGENKIRVSIMSNPDRHEAEKQLQEVRKDNIYKNAWLLVR